MVPVTPRTEFVSKDDASRPWFAVCEVNNCIFKVSAKTEEAARKVLDTHKCPSGGTTVIRKSQYEKIWDALDESTSIIMDSSTEAEKKEREKVYASALAFALSTFAHIDLTTMKEISREALARYHMRIGKIPFRPTSGYVFATQGAGMSPEVYAKEHGTPEQKRAAEEAAESRRRAEATSGASTRTPVAPKNTLADKEIAAIKAGLSGGMTPKDLAKLYGVRVQEVEALV